MKQFSKSKKLKVNHQILSRLPEIKKSDLKVGPLFLVKAHLPGPTKFFGATVEV